MRYLVTGATGFIGRNLCKILVQTGHQVLALARNPEKAKNVLPVNTIVSYGDITKKTTLQEPMQGVDGVFHLAAWYKIGSKDKEEAYLTNVEGTRNVLEVAKALNIAKVVYTSTVAVFSDTKGAKVNETYFHKGPWLSEYERTKWIAHYKVALPLAQTGLPLVIVQPGVVYGPEDSSAIGKSFTDYLRGQLPITPTKTAFCWGHVEDTARGHLLAMEKGKLYETYIIAGPIYSFREVFELAEKICGIKAPRLHPRPIILKTLSFFMKHVEGFFSLPAKYTAESLRLMAGTTYIASNKKAKQYLGFNPRSLTQGLRETLEFEINKLKIPIKLPKKIQ